MTSASESVPKALTTVFDEAEAAIKKYERLTLSLPVAAVNQLRYAAKHFARATKCECGSLEAEAHYVKARCHCERAKFDALDGIIYSSLDFIAAFQKMCRTRRGVEEIYPEIRSDYDAIAALQERIQLLPKVQDMSSGDMAEMEELAGKFLSFKRKILRLMPAVEARKRLVVDMSARNAAKQFLASCERVPIACNDPKDWERNTSAQSFSATWDEAEKAMRFDVAWTKPADRWFYPVYKLKLPQESFAGAQLIEFEVKSAQPRPSLTGRTGTPRWRRRSTSTTSRASASARTRRARSAPSGSAT